MGQYNLIVHPLPGSGFSSLFTTLSRFPTIMAKGSACESEPKGGSPCTWYVSQL